MELARTIHVDDHPLYCVGLQTALRLAGDVDFVGEAQSVAAALELVRRQRVHLALVDLTFPSGDGVALTAALREIQPDCKVIGLSMVDEPVRIAQMFRAGASGYVLKSQRTVELIEAIRLVLAGHEYLPAEISREEVERHRHSPEHSADRLTAREREVFTCLIRGQTNVEIGLLLSIALRTVETHRHRILAKLDARSLVQLVAIAHRYGLS